MDIGFWRSACEHFNRVLELPPDERADYLRELEDEMRSGVESLMAAEVEADDFLETPALSLGLMESLKAAAGKEPSLRLGPYLLERELSRSGMSRVFLARRDDGEYDKEVVVKIIARERASEELIVRFRRERQILAALDHPNIARLLDGGSTEEGLPYLVMEYVEGTPIDEYCDGERLSTRERLALFLEVCEAVDYAHGKGVIHRDLKPANILVSEAGVPKLLDFGIAKLRERHDAGFDGDGTSPDARPMTPYYASPEQVTGDAITRATDVYSLGVVLYKLLSGQLPYLLAERTPGAVKAAVLEQAAESLPLAASRGWPGAVASTAAVTWGGVEAVSAARRTTPDGLRRELGGELDSIVHMALRKEPERRYGTARELEDDLRRHLEGFPVEARGDGVGYRAAKYLRRNAARIAVAVLVAGAVATAAGIWLRSQGLREEQQRLARAQQESEKVLSFLGSLYELPAEMTRRGRRVAADQVLEVGGQEAARLLDSDPELAARAMRKIGEMYTSMGLELRAERWLSSAESVERSLARDAEYAAGNTETRGWRRLLSLNPLRSALRRSSPEQEAPPTPPAPLAVSVSGTCPGDFTLRVTGATPGSPVLLFGPTRTEPPAVDGDACRAAARALTGPWMLAVTLADSSGESLVSRKMPRLVCYETTYVVAVELATCAASAPVDVEASPPSRSPLRDPRQRRGIPGGRRRPAGSAPKRP